MWAIRFNATACSCTRRTNLSILRGANFYGNNLINRRINRRLLSATAKAAAPDAEQPEWSVEIDGTKYARDEAWFNIPQSVLSRVARRLHLQEEHPISITRQIIESVFPPPTFKYYNDLHPVVSKKQNFDSLGFPEDHPGRSKSDTYYINADALLRTHTSAHQADTFRANASEGYLISADVYRRDEVDRSHYPVFHQMEGARSWDRAKAPNGDVAAQIWSDVEKLPKHGIEVQDPNPPFHPERNPLQVAHHSPAEAEAVAAHLKRSLELAVVKIFSLAQTAAKQSDPDYVAEPLQVRWVEAYFPFTSPSWELEVFYDSEWLEVLGCGVVKHELYANGGVPDQLGWAFGIGLDRIAMLLFQIPDIRLFWSRDKRFRRQFQGVSASDPSSLRRYVPFSKYPGCWKDVSFWLDSTSDFHENDFMEIVRGVAGDVVEEIKKFDAFTHPETGRRSMAYRIVYCSPERTLTNNEANKLHNEINRLLVHKLGVTIR